MDIDLRTLEKINDLSSQINNIKTVASKTTRRTAKKTTKKTSTKNSKTSKQNKSSSDKRFS